MRKAQSSLEFVLLVSFALLMGSSFLYIVQQNLAETQNERDEARVMQLINLIETEYTLAERSPLGYRRTFMLPSSIDGNEYSVKGVGGAGSDHDLIVNFNGREYVYLMSNSLIVDYKNDLGPGDNNIYRECTPFFCTLIINSAT